MKKLLLKAAIVLQVGLLAFSGFGPLANVSYAQTDNIKPNPPGIYSVSNGQWVNSATINIMFTYSDPDGYAQDGYQIQRSYDNWTSIEYDSGEMPAATRHTLMNSQQGVNYVRVRVKDVLGAWSDWGYVYYYVDSQSPNPFTVTSAKYSNDPNGTYRVQALNVTDNLGINRVNFQSLYEGVWIDHGNGIPAGGDQWYMELPKRGEGLHTIKVTAYDNAGNYYGPVFEQFFVDTVAPTTPTVIPSTSEWTNGDVTVTIIPGTDSNSGVARTEYKLEGATVQDWTAYNGSFVISNEGETTISARTIDNAGNISGTATGLVRIDKTGPSGPTIVPSTTDWTNDDVLVTIVPGSDHSSGVKRTEYRLAGATVQDWTTYTTPITISNSGETTVYARTIDNLDNESAESAYVVRIDKDAPTDPVITPSVVGWTNENVGFTIGGSTDVNPITYEYKIGNGAFTVGTSGTVTDNGVTVVTARARDSLGNYSNEVQVTITIDKQPPNISFSANQRDWDSRDIELTIEYSDDLSGVNENKRFYKVTNSPSVPASWDTATNNLQPVTITGEGEWYVHAKVEDQVGNSASLSTSYLRLQRLPDVPGLVTASNIKETEATITWDLPPGGTLTDGYSYQVTNLTTNQTWTVPYPQNSITDTALEGGKVYQYTVQAFNHSGSSSVSTPISVLTLPKAPVNLRAYKVDGRPDQATVSFDPVESATAYRLVAKNPSNTVVYDQTVTETVYQMIEYLSAGMNYTISVSAINATGEGAPANVGFLSLPDIPGNFNAVTIEKDSIRLGWSTVPTATSYIVERDGQLIYRGTGTMFQDVGLESGTAYTYHLYAENPTGDGNPATLTVMTLPAAVTNVQISQHTADSFLVSWTGVKGAQNYVVKVNGQTEILGPDATSYRATGLEPGTAYTVEIYATNVSGAGDSVFEIGVTIPGVPNGIVLTPEETSAEISWNPVQGATKYRVTVGDKVQEVSGTTATVHGLEGSKTYSYSIEAGNTSGYGAPATGNLLTKPHQPTNIRVISRTEDTVELAWDADPTATGYTIIQDGVGPLATVQTNSYKVEGLSAAEVYRFEIITKNASGDSTPAIFNWVSQTLPVSNVVVTPGTTTARLQWDAVQGATEYVIYNGTAVIYRGTDPEAEITGLTEGTEYTFVIKALNAIGNDSVGTSVTFIQIPNKPVSVTASVTSSSVTLNLSASQVVGADEYIIERDGQEIARIPATNKAYTDNNLKPNTTYKYTVKASNVSGVSEGFELTVTTRSAFSGGGGIFIPPTPSEEKQPEEEAVPEQPAGEKGEDHDSSLPEAKREVKFTDIDHVFNKDQIIELAEAGIVQGVSDTAFEPSRPVKRAEFVALIVRLLKLEPIAYTDKFKDVKSTDWFASVVAAAVAHQLVVGVSDDRFAPENVITREQAAKIIANVLRMVERADVKGDVKFSDKDQISSWALDEVGFLAEKGLIHGYPDGTFRPKNELSRAEAVALIYNLMKYLEIR